MAEISVAEYATITGIQEEKLILYIKKGYMRGDCKPGTSWTICPDPFRLLCAKALDMDYPFAIAGVVKRHKILSVLAIFFMLLIVTKPERDTHISTVEPILLTATEMVLSTSGMQTGKGHFDELGMMMLNGFVLKVVERSLDYSDLWILSFMSYEHHVVSVGVAGYVFVAPQFTADSVAGVMRENLKEIKSLFR